MSFFPVPVDFVEENKKYEFSIYAYVAGKHVAYFPKEVEVSKEKLERLKERRVFVEEKEIHLYQKTYNNFLDNLDMSERSIHLKQEAYFQIESIFNDKDYSQAIKSSLPTLGGLVNFVMKEPEALKNLLSLNQHSHFLYNHSINVALYTLSMSIQVFDPPKEQYTSIMMGGFLHDLGKRSLSPELLLKKELSETETLEYRKHPVIGYELIKNEAFCNEIVSAIILQHHENFNGTGFPKGLQKDEINKFAKICSIADMFDNFTALRPNHLPLTMESAMQAIHHLRGERFDPKIIELIAIKKVKI